MKHMKNIVIAALLLLEGAALVNVMLKQAHLAHAIRDSGLEQAMSDQLGCDWVLGPEPTEPLNKWEIQEEFYFDMIKD